METTMTLTTCWILLALVLLTSVEATRRHQSGGLRANGSGQKADTRGPAWQVSRNNFIGGTDLLDWSRDPRRVDPKVYLHEEKCSYYGVDWTYSMTGQLEGQEWPAGLVKGEQLEPKSKAQLALCDSFRFKIDQDYPTSYIKLYLSENDIMLEREMSMEKCSLHDECPNREGNCTTYRLHDPLKAQLINGSISGDLSWQVESLLRDYGPMAVILNDRFKLDTNGFLDVSRICGSVSDQAIPLGNLLLVGYGRTNDGVGYFKFKSANGPNWGDGGFGYIRYTTHNKANCGHLYGLIELWRIKACERPKRGSHSRARPHRQRS